MAISLKNKKSLYCSKVCHAWCCRNLITFYDSNDPDIEQFLKLRGISYDNEKKAMVVPLKCKWITNQNKCKLYSWRPYSCREYQCEKLKAMTIDSQSWQEVDE
jgi:Fe-S-cluster containining protein